MAEFCATCFKEQGKEFKGKMVGGVCPECYKKMKGKDSISPEGMPQFKSMDELETFLKNAAKAEPKASTGKKKKAKAPPVDSGVNTSEVADVDIYQTNHFYLREKDTLEALRKDVKEERKIRNNNVLLFLHNHPFGETCNDQCKEVV